MHISRIYISNFTSIDEIEVNLAPMNIFVGANASGKSNLLKALKFIKNIKSIGLENAISSVGGIDYFQNINLPYNNKTIFEIDFNINSINGISTINNIILSKNTDCFTYKVEIIKKNKDFVIQYESITFKSKIHILENTKNNDFLEKMIDYEDNYKIVRAKALKFYKNNKLLNLTKKLEKNKFNFFSKSGKKYQEWLDIPLQFEVLFGIHQKNYSKNINNKITLIEQYSLLFQFGIFDYEIYDFDLKKAKGITSLTGKSSLEPNGENLALVLQNLLKDSEKLVRFTNLLNDILPYIQKIDTEKLFNNSLLFKIKEKYNNDKLLPSSFLSDGTISITLTLIALFFENNRLLAIEEPENGIHPTLIEKMMNLFYDTSKNVQIIITTHNPEVLKHIQNLSDLQLVNRNENGFTTVSKPIDNIMVQEFLKSELGISDLYLQNLLDI